jgi:hypothetical protein
MSNWMSTDIDELSIRLDWRREGVNHEAAPYDATVVYVKDDERITVDFFERQGINGDYVARATHRIAGSDAIYRRDQQGYGHDAFGLAVMWMIDATRQPVH